MRPALIKGFALGLLTGTAVVASAAILAGTAKADTDGAAFAYAAAYGTVVCQVLDEYPTYGGIEGIAEAIVEDGLSYYQAGEVIALSVIRICPQHTALMNRYVTAEARGVA